MTNVQFNHQEKDHYGGPRPDETVILQHPPTPPVSPAPPVSPPVPTIPGPRVPREPASGPHRDPWSGPYRDAEPQSRPEAHRRPGPAPSGAADQHPYRVPQQRRYPGEAPPQAPVSPQVSFHNGARQAPFDPAAAPRTQRPAPPQPPFRVPQQPPFGASEQAPYRAPDQQAPYQAPFRAPEQAHVRAPERAPYRTPDQQAPHRVPDQQIPYRAPDQPAFSRQAPYRAPEQPPLRLPDHPVSRVQRDPDAPAPAKREPRPDETFIIEPITMPPSRQQARMALRHATWKPGILSGLIPFLAVLVFSWWLAQPGHGPLGWALTILWSWPIISSLVGIYGALATRINLGRRRKYLDDSEAFRCNDLLVVVVPTIGRHDTYPALERSVLSYVHHLPSCFPQMRVDIITEEGCEAHERIKLLGARSEMIRVVTVPKAYTTPNGTRFKARANHYSHEQRISEGEARDDVWVLHMDDDTGVAMDTAIAMAQFIERQRWAGADARHLAQGILTYPRENAVNMLTWLADAVRPADDIARFAAFTGHGTPLSGLHGELLLVRASIEATIGWDFGPKAIVEDAQLALTFCRRYPGRSSWFQGRCYGASPATVRDFIKQRERWAWGLVGLACNRTIPFRHRVFLAYSVVSWVAGPLQHVAVVLLIGAALGDMNTTPVSLAILPLWAINMGYTVWMYMEGLKINARVSDSGRRRWWEPLAVLCLIPVFSLMEGIGGFLGFVKFIRRAENKFVVIAKPA